MSPCGGTLPDARIYTPPYLLIRAARVSKRSAHARTRGPLDSNGNRLPYGRGSAHYVPPMATKPEDAAPRFGVSAVPKLGHFTFACGTGVPPVRQ